MQPLKEVIAHVVLHPQLSVTQIKPLQLDQLQPDLLANTTFTEFLAQQLISRTATRQGIKALVLSAPYLPSQLFTMKALAAKQSVESSLYVSSDSSTLHTVLYRLQHAAPAALQQGQQDQQDLPQGLAVSDLEQALSGVLGPIQPLPPARLQVAVAAEQSMRRQLRLWDPATWSSVLQQQLESRRSHWPYLAIRSLMGPPALQAAQQLVERKGLYWLEVPADAINSSNGKSDGSGGTGRRRRKDSAGSSAAVTAEARVAVVPGVVQSVSGDKVIIVSKVDLTEVDMDLREDAFTDYMYRAGGSMQQGTTQQAEATTWGEAGNPVSNFLARFYSN
jgi:hypothetical protein